MKCLSLLCQSRILLSTTVQFSLSRQGIQISALEEIAYHNGWITKDDVLAVYEVMKKNQYGQYLKDVLDGKYIDVIRERTQK